MHEMEEAIEALKGVTDSHRRELSKQMRDKREMESRLMAMETKANDLGNRNLVLKAEVAILRKMLALRCEHLTKELDAVKVVLGDVQGDLVLTCIAVCCCIACIVRSAHCVYCRISALCVLRALRVL